MPGARRRTTAASPTLGATASPSAQVLIYDGDCRFCVRRASWFQRKSRQAAEHQAAQRQVAQRQTVRAVPYQQLDLSSDSVLPSESDLSPESDLARPTLTQQTLSEQTLSQQTLSRQAVWIDAAGKQHLGHRAVAKSLIHIGGWWGICGRVMLVPPISWLARGVYRLVAHQRHRLA